MIFFAFQIYCDFAGYTAIARGTARVLGFELMKNFDKPYMSISVTEFWRRWHISLSTWFRDYLYIGLGGNRKRPYFNLLFTFGISGLWHGANWTFVIWGLINGVAIALERLFKINVKGAAQSDARPKKLFKAVATFSIICIAWVFFRAGSASEAVQILQRIFSFESGPQGIWEFLDSHMISSLNLYLGSLLIVSLFLAEKFSSTSERLKSNPLTYAFLLWAIISFGVFKQEQFIYFQF